MNGKGSSEHTDLKSRRPWDHKISKSILQTEGDLVPWWVTKTFHTLLRLSK